MKLFSSLDPKDRKLLIACILIVMMLTAVLAFFSRNENNDDNPLPSSYLTGKHGARAAFEMLRASGYDVQRWEEPLGELAARADAQTVVIFAEPMPGSPGDMQAVQQIVQHGARVLLTGWMGGLLAPGSDVRPPMQFQASCTLTPEGFDPLAASGTVWMVPEAGWGSDRPRDRVEYNCAGTPAVVEYSDGKGEVIWWASSTPLENGSISRDGNLNLFLNTLGPREGHKFFWDESLHGETRSEWFYARGPALWLLLGGLVGIGLLTILSFSRRRGPVRDFPAQVRTTPVEFLEALGALYAEARASATAVQLAYERFRRKAGDLCGLNAAQMSASELGHVLRRRFPQADSSLEKDLLDCEEAVQNDELGPKDALAMVQMLNRHLELLEETVKTRVA